MKSVGIVTFFKSYNYGVWLQAYATQTFFGKEGYKVQIINYANKLEMQTISYFFIGYLDTLHHLLNLFFLEKLNIIKRVLQTI